MTERARDRDDELADIRDAAEEDDPTGVTEVEDGEPLLPPDSPSAVQAYGIRADEQRAGPSFDRRLSEEEPDVGARRDVAPEAEGEADDIDAEDAALRVVEGPDRLPGATDDPVDHYVEDAEAEEASLTPGDRRRVRAPASGEPIGHPEHETEVGHGDR